MSINETLNVEDLNIKADWELKESEMLEMKNFVNGKDFNEIKTDIEKDQNLKDLIYRDYAKYNKAMLNPYGISIEDLQKALNRFEGINIGEDNSFGQSTFAALIVAQRRISEKTNISVNGVCFLSTISILFPEKFPTYNKNEFGLSKNDIINKVFKLEAKKAEKEKEIKEKTQVQTKELKVEVQAKIIKDETHIITEKEVKESLKIVKNEVKVDKTPKNEEVKNDMYEDPYDKFLSKLFSSTEDKTEETLEENDIYSNMKEKIIYTKGVRIRNKGMAGIISRPPEYSKNNVTLCGRTTRKNFQDYGIYIPWLESNDLINVIDKYGIDYYKNLKKSDKNWPTTIPDRIIGNDYNSLKDGEYAHVLASSTTEKGSDYGHMFTITKQNGRVYAIDGYRNPIDGGVEMFPIEKHATLNQIKKIVVYNTSIYVNPKILKKSQEKYSKYESFDKK